MASKSVLLGEDAMCNKGVIRVVDPVLPGSQDTSGEESKDSYAEIHAAEERLGKRMQKIEEAMKLLGKQEVPFEKQKVEENELEDAPEPAILKCLERQMMKLVAFIQTMVESLFPCVEELGDQWKTCLPLAPTSFSQSPAPNDTMNASSIASTASSSGVVHFVVPSRASTSAGTTSSHSLVPNTSTFQPSTPITSVSQPPALTSTHKGATAVSSNKSNSSSSAAVHFVVSSRASTCASAISASHPPAPTSALKGVTVTYTVTHIHSFAAHC